MSFAEDDFDLDSGFHKVWLEDRLIPAIEAVGSKKSKVLAYLLSNMDTNNRVVASVREIARQTETSPFTVSKALQALENIDFVNRNVNVTMVNPDAVWYGSKRGRYYCRKEHYLETGSENSGDLPFQ